MNVAVRYYTRSGNTKKLAAAIGEAAGVPAEEVCTALQEKADILFLGSSPYGFDVDEAVKVFIEENGDKIGKIVNFSTAALIKSTYKNVKKLADAKGIPMAKEEFYCRGSFGPAHKGRPNEQDLNDAREFAKKLLQAAEDDR